MIFNHYQGTYIDYGTKINDNRRSKFKCCFHNNGQCIKNGFTCIGSAHCSSYNTGNLPKRYRTDIPVKRIELSDEDREKKNNEVLRKHALKVLRNEEFKRQRKMRTKKTLKK